MNRFVIAAIALTTTPMLIGVAFQSAAHPTAIAAPTADHSVMEDRMQDCEDILRHHVVNPMIPSRADFANYEYTGKPGGENWTITMNITANNYFGAPAPAIWTCKGTHHDTEIKTHLTR